MTARAPACFDVPMFVRLDYARGQVTLEEPTDFKQFHLVVRGDASVARLSDELQKLRVGTVGADGHARLWVDALLRMAQHHAGSSDWQRSFDGMLSYAKGKGWVEDLGRSVRAHVLHEPA